MIGTPEMARRADVSLRQLDVWVTEGRVSPAVTSGGTGYPRRWHEWQLGEVVEVRETLRPVSVLRYKGGRA